MRSEPDDPDAEGCSDDRSCSKQQARVLIPSPFFLEFATDKRSFPDGYLLVASTFEGAELLKALVVVDASLLGAVLFLEREFPL